MINLAKPSISEMEKFNVNQALNEGAISQGSFISQFEQSWAEWNGYKYGTACSSGTAALFLALKALGIGEGDEVIVPEFTMAATAWAVSYTGAKPVFVDCADDLNMDVNKISAAITEKTRAIIAVPIYGRNSHTEFINVIARRHFLYVIEDMAEAHGIKPKGDIACYSFQITKILTTGEGGMCIANNKRFTDEIRQLSTLYFDKDRTLIHRKMGYNFKMTNLQAAIGVAQVDRINEILVKRRLIEAWYDKLLPEKVRMRPREVLWMYDVNVGPKRDFIKADLAKMGIETRYFFKPMSSQPMYLDPNRPPFPVLNAQKWSEVGLYLPTYTDMTYEDVDKVCTSLISVLNKYDTATI